MLELIEEVLGVAPETSGSVLGGLYGLAVLAPTFAVGARRLHDTGRSGWWQVFWWVPIIGWIVLLVFLVQDSEPGENRYGPNPKLAGA